MEMKEFSTKVCAAVQKRLGTDYRVEVKEVCKNNGVVLQGLTILAQGQNVAPTIYLEDFLEAYEQGVSFQKIVQKLLDVYMNVPEKSIDMDFFRSFEKVRDRICFRLIGRKENGELLKDIPHTDFLDLAVCFYYAYQGEDLGEGSILIYNSHMEMWGTNAIELLSLAKRNTPRLFPWTCYSLGEIISRMMGESAGLLDDEFLSDRLLKALTNSRGVYGAACILYPGVLEELARKEGCGFYIIPSSVHEVMLFPDTYTRMSAHDIKQMVEDVNRTQLDPREVLSDSVYYYDAAGKRVKVAL